MLLGDIATLQAGVLTNRVLYDARSGDKKDTAEKKRERSYEKIRILIPKAIHDGAVDHSLIEEQELIIDPRTGEAKDVTDFRTRIGDIVIKLSSPYDACVITERDAGLLIPSFCLRIVVKEAKIDRDFLLAFFSSTVFLGELRKKCYGTVMALAKKSDFEKIDIPDIPLGKQIEIGRRFRKVETLKSQVRKYCSLERERLDRILEAEEC